MRRAGRALLQLGRQAGRPATVLLSTLCCFGNFMKKEGRGGTAGGGIAGESCSPDTWRQTSWVRRGAGWWGWVEGEENETMMEEGESGAERELWLRASWVTAEQVMAVLLLLLPPSSQFHFHGL